MVSISSSSTSCSNLYNNNNNKRNIHSTATTTRTKTRTTICDTVHTGRWTEEEHSLFLLGLERYPDRQWKKIAEIVQSRTVVQVRTHAQKYFQKRVRTDYDPINQINKYNNNNNNNNSNNIQDSFHINHKLSSTSTMEILESLENSSEDEYINYKKLNKKNSYIHLNNSNSNKIQNDLNNDHINIILKKNCNIINNDENKSFLYSNDFYDMKKDINYNEKLQDKKEDIEKNHSNYINQINFFIQNNESELDQMNEKSDLESISVNSQTCLSPKNIEYESNSEIMKTDNDDVDCTKTTRRARPFKRISNEICNPIKKKTQFYMNTRTELINSNDLCNHIIGNNNDIKIKYKKNPSCISNENIIKKNKDSILSEENLQKHDHYYDTIHPLNHSTSQISSNSSNITSSSYHSLSSSSNHHSNSEKSISESIHNDTILNRFSYENELDIDQPVRSPSPRNNYDSLDMTEPFEYHKKLDNLNTLNVDDKEKPLLMDNTLKNPNYTRKYYIDQDIPSAICEKYTMDCLLNNTNDYGIDNTLFESLRKANISMQLQDSENTLGIMFLDDLNNNICFMEPTEPLNSIHTNYKLNDLQINISSPKKSSIMSYTYNEKENDENNIKSTFVYKQTKNKNYYHNILDPYTFSENYLSDIEHKIF